MMHRLGCNPDDHPHVGLFDTYDKDALSTGSAVGLLAFLAAIVGQLLLWRWQCGRARGTSLVSPGREAGTRMMGARAPAACEIGVA